MADTVLNLHDRIARLDRKDFVQVQAGRPRQLSVFQEQQLCERKLQTTTVRIRTDLMDRVKVIARKHSIRNHGKLLNILLDEMLIKLESDQ